MNPSVMNPSVDEFAAMLDESFADNKIVEGSVVGGRITAIENGFAIIDVGLKMEGRVPLREFSELGAEPQIAIGDTVDVFLERIENALGEAVLSRDKAHRAANWTKLEKTFADETSIEATIINRVKGGFTVDLGGILAFLPNSQVDVHPIRDIAPLMEKPQPFKILKMDKAQNNIVVSRRAVMEHNRTEGRRELVQGLSEGQIVEGEVKNLTEYGAFIDLGGIDGLLHVTDIAWRRINHPSEALTMGDKIRVQILRINNENQRISLGMKQLIPDPWVGIETKFAVGDTINGRVSNITEYGAFIDLGEGVEGLVHVSEMSWIKKNTEPGKIVSTSQEIDVKVLEIDIPKRRISLSLRQCIDNPWNEFADKHPPGTRITGTLRNKTEFGLFIGLTDDIDGMVYMSDIEWGQDGKQALNNYEIGQEVEAVITEINTTKERISLSIKALTGDDPFAGADGLKKGTKVSAMVTAVTPDGLEVALSQYGDLPATVRRAELSSERAEQRPERFTIGDEIQAQISNVNWKSHRIGLSIKAFEIAEEQQALKDYNPDEGTKSGTSLGDILKAASQRVTGEKGGEKEAKSEEAKKPAQAKKASAKKAETPDEAPASENNEADSKDNDKEES